MTTDQRPTTDRRPTDDRPQGKFTHFGKISNGHNSATRQPIPFMFGSRWGFRGRRIQRRHFRLDQIQVGGRRPSWKTSNGHISVTRRPIDFVFGPRVGFSGTADPTAPFLAGSNSRWQPAAILEKFKWPYLSNVLSDSLYVCTQIILCRRSLIYSDEDSKLIS